MIPSLPAHANALLTPLILPAALALLLIGALLVAWRGSLLLKLGARNVPRRPLRAILIVFGLTLSTAVIGASLSTGSMMSGTIRSLVSQSLGPVDEVVVSNPQRDSLRDQVKALNDPGLGGLAASNPRFFSQDLARQLLARESAGEGSGASGRPIAGLAPAIVRQVTVVQPEKRQLQTSLLLVAVPVPYPAVFGDLRTVDGASIQFGGLQPNQVILNQSAAKLFGASTGQALQVIDSLAPVDTTAPTPTPTPTPWDVRVAAVSEDGGLVGLQAALIVPLSHYQAMLNQPGWINTVLVANHGGARSVDESETATTSLRLALADHDAALTLYDVLHQPETQQALLNAEADRRGDERTRISDLRREAARPEMTDRFVSLVTEPQTRRGLFALASQLPGSQGRYSIYRSLRSVAALSVVPVKQAALDRADQYGEVVTTVFLVLGIFSFAAAAVLIFLIFSLLAADRRAELATIRALGMSRRQIMTMFLFEGLIYDLLAAVIGALIGLGASYLTTVSLARTLRLFGFQLSWQVDPRGLLIAFSAGVLLTFVAMLAAAWRVSRSEIVAATRGDAVDERRGWLIVPGVLLLSAAGLVWQHWRTPPLFYEPRHPLVVPGALSLALIGVASCLAGLAGLLAQRLPPRSANRIERLADGATTLLILILVLVWLRTFHRLPTPGGELASDAVTLAVGGLALALALTWFVARALGPLLKLADAVLSALARIRSVVRPVAGELGRERLRSGLSIVMFGLVIFSMVVALTLIDSLVATYAGEEPPIAGFALRADQQSGGDPITDMRATLAQAKAKTVNPDDLTTIGSITATPVEAVQLGTASSSWRSAELNIVNDGFLRGIRATIRRQVTDDGGDQDIWRKLREQPGTAVVSSSLLDDGVTIPGSSTADTMPPVTLWVRPEQEGRPVRLTVIGVIDSRSELDDGLYTSQATAAGLGIELPSPDTFLFTLRPGANADDVAQGLRLALADHDVSVGTLSSSVQIGQSIRVLLTQIVQGFMGLGLVAGVAALGMLGVQAVIERRTQLGTLRALGFTPWQTRATIALESGMIGAAGIAIGVGLGLVLARALIALLAQHYPEIQYVVPWEQIGLSATLALAGSVGAIGASVWQAGRISPADALRAT